MNGRGHCRLPALYTLYLLGTVITLSCKLIPLLYAAAPGSW